MPEATPQFAWRSSVELVASRSVRFRRGGQIEPGSIAESIPARGHPRKHGLAGSARGSARTKTRERAEDVDTSEPPAVEVSRFWARLRPADAPQERHIDAAMPVTHSRGTCAGMVLSTPFAPRQMSDLGKGLPKTAVHARLLSRPDSGVGDRRGCHGRGRGDRGNGSHGEPPADAPAGDGDVRPGGRHVADERVDLRGRSRTWTRRPAACSPPSRSRRWSRRRSS